MVARCLTDLTEMALKSTVGLVFGRKHCKAPEGSDQFLVQMGQHCHVSFRKSFISLKRIMKLYGILPQAFSKNLKSKDSWFGSKSCISYNIWGKTKISSNETNMAAWVLFAPCLDLFLWGIFLGFLPNTCQPLICHL